MKKMILAVAIMLATFGSAQAASKKSEKKVERNAKEVVDMVMSTSDSTVNVISFYNVEKIQVKNDSNVVIRIYDAKWNLIEETQSDVNKSVAPGDYYVSCSKKMKSVYVAR